MSPISVLCAGNRELSGKSRSFELGKQALSDAEYRRGFFSEEMWKNVDELSPECKTLLKNVENESGLFPRFQTHCG